MKIHTSIKLDEEVWKNAKKYCIDKHTNLSKLIEDLLKNMLSEEEN